MKIIKQNLIKWLSLALVLSVLQLSNASAYETTPQQNHAANALKAPAKVEAVKVPAEVKVSMVDFDADKATQA